MEERRGSWYLLTGLVLGAVLGLLYAWAVSPVKYVDTAPLSLRADFKDTYRRVIAAAYAANQDIGRARARLALLNDADPAQSLAAQAQRILADGGSANEARSLALLAAALSRPPTTGSTTAPPPISAQLTATASLSPTVTPSLAPSFTPTNRLTVTLSPTAGLTQVLPSATPTRLTSTPTLTTTPGKKVAPLPTQPSLTPSLTPGLPFVLKERSKVCDSASPEPLIQVQLNDAAGQPVPGVEIRITWANGEDHFFTGFRPEVNPGFADFLMAEGNVYSLEILDGGVPLGGLGGVECSLPGGQTFVGGWYLKFQQP